MRFGFEKYLQIHVYFFRLESTAVTVLCIYLCHTQLRDQIPKFLPSYQ